jgi:hypothetical protein
MLHDKQYHVILHILNIITNFLLTEREVFTEKYRTEVFFVQTTDQACRARFLQKDRGPIVFCKYRASEVNKKFIIWHLYLKQTRNA